MVILLIIYIVILIFLITYFVKCLKNKAKWSRLFIFEIISIVLSTVLLVYYNNLPVSGFMPGLTYLGEVLFSFCAMIIYSLIFVVTIVTKLTIMFVKK